MKRVRYEYFFKDGYCYTSTVKFLSKSLFIELIKKHGKYLGQRVVVYGWEGVKIEI